MKKKYKIKLVKMQQAIEAIVGGSEDQITTEEKIKTMKDNTF